MDPNMTKREEQPAPTGMMAWVGFGLGIMALASLCICFASPYWIQTWPLSESEFKNMGLWSVCFNNYMQFKDDSQERYTGCWWVFDRQTKYYKLREWLTPPWFISCQVLTVGCLIALICTIIITALVFLHLCPIMNHEYLQTYGMFVTGSLMFMCTMITCVIAIIFGGQMNDRMWLPRPDLNFLSWGFGFLIIAGIFCFGSGFCLYMEAQKTYNLLSDKEDVYTKAALEMSTYQLDPVNPPGYDSLHSQPGYDYSRTHKDMAGPSGDVSYPAQEQSFEKLPLGGYDMPMVSMESKSKPMVIGSSYGQLQQQQQQPTNQQALGAKSFQTDTTEGADFV